MATLEHTIASHASDVNWVAFSSTVLASCSGDKTVRLWEVGTWAELPCSPLLGHSYPVHCCCFSSFGTQLATCSTDGTINLWGSKSGQRLTTLAHPRNNGMRTVSFSPDSNVLVAGSVDGTLVLWDAYTKEMLSPQGLGPPGPPVVIEAHDTSICACAFTPDGNFLLSGSMEGNMKLWDGRYGNNKCLYYLAEGHDLGVTCCVFSPTFGSANPDNPLPDTRLQYFMLASCGADMLVKLWDVQVSPGYDMRLRVNLQGHSATVNSCAFTPDGKRLASGSVDRAAIVWNPLTGEKLYMLTGHPRCVTTVAFSLDAMYLATGCMDRTVRIWRLADGPAVIPVQDAASKTESPTEMLVDVDNAAAPITAQKTTEPPQPKRKPLSDWSVEQVCDWLREKGLEQHVQTFRENEIDGSELKQLTNETLSKDLGIAALGQRNKILRGIKALEESESSTSSGQANLAALASALPPQLMQNLPALVSTFAPSLMANMAQSEGPTVTTTQAAAADDKVPDEYLCPISREIMVDPVIASDGYTYERKSIESWLHKGKMTSPMTNALLPNMNLTPNRMLKMLIQRHFGGGQ
ncbi:PREDICTED: WD repeat, SAM and U-box domain-containing protein 1-like isoform X1 [Branchiostoma belcheri]|uniref:WD repeat, SAM and U-box domain-containing protein 1 n=1 Tax=Branchiostoma belcheri TaxID=7741 RepID=A0A6P5ANN1_BRABE|nr:PREDICTED: WD repeat, SAM and U-box domain-containing protein 1-like isoform X1 [Branchiostoma belcheri]XP_019647750.1 PREDICTED: WD repeat, SAM and U-box domain-containing protein 1-like isoform X1 [Branchiostoma belcheri]